MYKRKFPTIAIMKLTGHTTESNFLKYIKVTPEENAAMMADEFFKCKNPFWFWGNWGRFEGTANSNPLIINNEKATICALSQELKWWLNYMIICGFVLFSPFCHIAVDKGATATISTPTQSCVETDYQSVIHHSRPYRGRSKGTSQQLRYSFPYPKTTIFVHFLSIFSWFLLVLVYLGSSKHDATL